MNKIQPTSSSSSSSTKDSSDYEKEANKKVKLKIKRTYLDDENEEIVEFFDQHHVLNIPYFLHN